jgi:hypothetical protein
MSETKTIVHGIYDDEVPLLEGVKKLKGAGIRIRDVFTPFAVHGLDSALGIPRTRIAICAFIYGVTGASLATLMMWYMMVHDWPADIGGKPNWYYFQAVPAFIPITFESTVFCAAHGMAITFLLRCWLVPGVKPKNPDPRSTDDKFLVYLELSGEEQLTKASEILRATGASEINNRATVSVTDKGLY